MHHITINCDGYNKPGFYEIQKVIFCRTKCESPADITIWVNEAFGDMNPEWAYSSAKDIASHEFDYFNPYLGSFN
jgi:hypothetical protein